MKKNFSIALCSLIFGLSILTPEKTGANSAIFEIRNAANGKCLDAQQYGMPNGANVQLWDCNGEKWQKWYEAPNGQIRNAANDKCLDAQQYGMPNGANVQLWDCNGERWQKWSVVGGEYVNNANDKCLDAQEYGKPNGANVQLWDCNKKGWQLWRAWR